MNQGLKVNRMASNNLHPTDLLEELSGSQTDGCLQVSNGSVSYLIYLEQGKLIYATHSVDPFERLERHLRRLSNETTTLTSSVRTQARLNFETDSQKPSEPPSDYQALCWLVEQQYLTEIQAAILVERLTREVFETYLLFSEITEKSFIDKIDKLPIFCQLYLPSFLEECRKKIQAWKALSPQIWSSYQRPYFSSASSAQPKQTLGMLLLRGFSFRQIAALLNQDELILAKKLYPHIVNKTIILGEPQPPFDQFPKISDYSPKLATDATKKAVGGRRSEVGEQLEEACTELRGKGGESRLPSAESPLPSKAEALVNVPTEVQTDMSLAELPNAPLLQKNWKIACVDDSKVILHAINRFLDQDDFSVFTINNSLKALMEIIRIKPDLILLDVNMPNINGYKLCSLLRKSSLFKTTPIVMVTGNKSLIDRAKARLAGATDYLTKPFTQSELLKMVFRYLT